MDERSPLLAGEDKMATTPGLAEGIDPRIPSFTRALKTGDADGTKQLPQAIAHRGYKAQHPENTMAAFRGAVEVGAHAVETDLHISKDGVVVLSHDPTLKRCFGLEDKIIDCEWSYLKELYTLKEPKERMPRLKDLLEYMATPGAEHIWVLLDIKLDNDPDDIMRLIASTIEEVKPAPNRPWNERIILGCWAAKYIPLCEKHLPTFPITFIGFSISYARKFLTYPSIPPISFNLLQKILVGPRGASFLADIKKAQRVVFVWTVNETSWMKWCVRKGVDGVVTDDPKLFLEVCGEGEGEGVFGVQRKGDGVSLREWVVLIGIQILAAVLATIYKRRYPFGQVRGKEEVGKRKGWRIAA